MPKRDYFLCFSRRLRFANGSFPKHFGFFFFSASSRSIMIWKMRCTSKFSSENILSWWIFDSSLWTLSLSRSNSRPLDENRCRYMNTRNCVEDRDSRDCLFRLLLISQCPCLNQINFLSYSKHRVCVELISSFLRCANLSRQRVKWFLTKRSSISSSFACERKIDCLRIFCAIGFL